MGQQCHPQKSRVDDIGNSRKRQRLEQAEKQRDVDPAILKDSVESEMKWWTDLKSPKKRYIPDVSRHKIEKKNLLIKKLTLVCSLST